MIRPDIPIENSASQEKRELYLRLLRSAEAGRVWLVVNRNTLFGTPAFDRKKEVETLSENLRFFEGNGFETGIWFQSFGFGNPLPKEISCSWTRLRSIEGEQPDVDAFCPEDPDFLKAYAEWVKDLAGSGARLMMLDDDLCMSVRPGIGCFCHRHLKLLEEKAGELPKDLREIFTGGKNKYRDAYYEVMGNSMLAFCKKVREAVDSVDPTIRVGLCAGYTSWDMEGTDPIAMSRALAGNTKPFFRLTSAPYWVAPNKVSRFPGMKLPGVIENARNQIAWSKNTDIEIFGEADSHPRYCYCTPAMMIENFDIALHTAGVKSLKYVFNYVASPEYEKQYMKMHLRNAPLREQVELQFSGTKECGVRLYRPMHRITDSILPHEFMGESEVMATYFSSAAGMMTSLGIPVCYDGESDCACVFGDDALYFENKNKKVILDLPAALLLQERGIDTGIRSVSPATRPGFELFEREKLQITRTNKKAKFQQITLKDGAVEKSRFDNGTVASFEYKNFLVLNFNGQEVRDSSSLFCSYARGDQVRAFFGNPYPTIRGFTDVYCILAEKQGGHAALFQNFSVDPIFDFDIELPKPCKTFSLYGAEGVCDGNRIHITSDFAPSGTILLSVEYV